MKLSILSKHKKSSGTTRIRCLQLIEYLSLIQISSKLNQIYNGIPRKSDDFCMLHRAQCDAYTLDLVAYAKALNIPVIYDTDDLLFEEIYDKRLNNLIDKRSQSFRCAMNLCDVITVSTNFLREKALKYHNNVFLIKNALSNDFFKKSTTNFELRSKKKQKHIVLSYLSGSNSHDSDFAQIEDVLVTILETYKFLKLLIVGPLNYKKQLFEKFNSRFEHKSKVLYDDYHLIFQKIDVNLVPLELSDFNHAKSELKYIEAGASGIPSVLSPSITHKEVIVNGKNGFLCYNKKDWIDTLALLITNSELREKIGVAARNHVCDEYTAEARSKDLSLFFDCINKKFEEKKSISNPSNFFLILGLSIKLHIYRFIWKLRNLKRVIT